MRILKSNVERKLNILDLGIFVYTLNYDSQFLCPVRLRSWYATKRWYDISNFFIGKSE